MRSFQRRLALAACLLVFAPAARAQFAAVHATPSGPGPGRDEPVTFTADQVSYDRENSIITASGHVEAWQNDTTLFADQISFDRNTGLAAATGHVVVLQPDGQTVFADYAELTQGMRDAVLKGMGAMLAENGKLAANGARRSEGKINEMARVVYSTCDLCKDDPTRPPLWQIRARTAVQDTEHKRIEYQDAYVDMFGVPVAYFPYFWHVDPSVKRASGILPPDIGTAKHLGAFAAQPYYWVLDDQSDVILTPMMTAQKGAQLSGTYRRAFNDGDLRINASVADDNGPSGHIFAKGQFALNETWRYGFDINEASSSTYLRDFRIQGSGLAFLTSSVYAEGFGEGAYARIDAQSYQGLTEQVNRSNLPVVAPNYRYSFFGEPDGLGGRTMVDVAAFNVLRSVGTSDQQAQIQATWERPFTGAVGDLWKASVNVAAVGASATSMNLTPTWSTVGSAQADTGLPQAALEMRWPWARSGDWGRQVIEPIVQVIGAPILGVNTFTNIPNEDSLDLQFTDANLFSWNRYPGLNRMESGPRANVGLHGAWFFPSGMSVDTLVGQSYRTHEDNIFPIGSGLNKTVSDVVGRMTLIPSEYLDFTMRGRFRSNDFAPQYGEAIAGFGVPALRLNVGYVYDVTNPYNLYDTSPGLVVPVSILAPTPHNEVSLGGTAKYGHWRLTGYARRDLATNTMVAVGATGAYEDECFIFAVNFYRRYTTLNGDNGSQAVLFQVTFKTIGQFGFHAF